jgi:arylsulfatase A-like enzyme
MGRPNVLFITLDQFRADALSCAGHPVVRTPYLDALARDGVRLARHYSQAAPCAPGRAALYTGTYQMNNRVVGNGTPLDDRFDNVARVARRAGYRPALFGYTDTGADPRVLASSDDRRLSDYEGVLPGFDPVLDMPSPCKQWRRWLRDQGVDPGKKKQALRTENERPVEQSVSAFLTDNLLGWIDRQDEPWFAHASYLRPHPPYSAAGHFSTMYSPDELDDPVPPGPPLNRLHAALAEHPKLRAPTEPHELRRMRAQYYGMVSHVDEQLGRVCAHLRATGQWGDTVIVVTADHGEQLGDQGLHDKAGFFEASYRIVGIVRDPQRPEGHGTVVERFTENVDLLPTLCELIGVPVPAQCDGLPLTPFLRGEEPPWWRSGAHYEFDWRDQLIPLRDFPWPWDRTLERQHLAVRRSAERAFVQFGNGESLCFDLAADPTWRTVTEDPATMLAEAQAMLAWRGQHLERSLTGMLLVDGGIGRRPPGFLEG